MLSLTRISSIPWNTLYHRSNIRLHLPFKSYAPSLRLFLCFFSDTPPISRDHAYTDNHAIIISKISLFNLPSRDIASESDPYVHVNHRDDKNETAVVRNNNNPAWWPTFVIFPDRPYVPINFVIMDRNLHLIGDKEIGTFTISTGALLEKFQEHKFTVVTGNISLNPDITDSEGKQIHSTYKVEFQYEKWEVHFGYKGKHHMDLFNRLLWIAIKKVIVDLPKVRGTDVPIPTRQLTPNQLGQLKVTDKFNIGATDLTVDPFEKKVFLFTKILRSVWKREDNSHWDSREEGMETISSILGSYLPEPSEGVWTGIATDEILTRFFFSGIGSSRIDALPNGQGFVSNFDDLKKYAVRPGFSPYHGRLYFSPEGKPTHIVWNGQTVRPGDENWERAKYYIRSTAIASVTHVEHLVWTHFIWSGITTSTLTVYLPPNHPIRRLLHIHTYRAILVNVSAREILVPDGAVLSRNTAYTYPALVQALDDIYESFHYQPFPKYIEKKGLLNLPGSLYPMSEDGIEYHKIISSYVKNYIHLYYKNDEQLENDAEFIEFWKQYSSAIPNGLPNLSLDSVIEVFTEFIFTVSAWHTHVGNVTAYTRDPAFAGPVAIEGEGMTRPQIQFTQGLIVAGTSGQMPMMLDDFSHLMLDDDAVNVLKNMQSELRKLSQLIDQRNTQRPYTFNTFNPQYMYTSVAV